MKDEFSVWYVLSISFFAGLGTALSWSWTWEGFIAGVFLSVILTALLLISARVAENGKAIKKILEILEKEK